MGGRGGGWGGGGVTVVIAQGSHTFMRVCWFIAYTIRVESLLPDVQELLCTSYVQDCNGCYNSQPFNACVKLVVIIDSAFFIRKVVTFVGYLF